MSDNFTMYRKGGLVNIRNLKEREDYNGLLQKGIAVQQCYGDLPLEVFRRGKIAQSVDNPNDTYYVPEAGFKQFTPMDVVAENVAVDTSAEEAVENPPIEVDLDDARSIRSDDHTAVYCLDQPGAGGACHEYIVVDSDRILTSVSFQNGPVKESGVNGCTNEDLLAIIIDRLSGFQSGSFPCVENVEALIYLQGALEQLESRTGERSSRGVEGVNEA